MQTTTNKSFELMALAFGIISIISVTTILIPLILGSLAIIFAILSRGSDKEFSTKSKYGFITGLASIAISVVLFASTAYLIFFNQDYRAFINETYQAQFGMTFDEYLDTVSDVFNGEITDETLQNMQQINEKSTLQL